MNAVSACAYLPVASGCIDAILQNRIPLRCGHQTKRTRGLSPIIPRGYVKRGRQKTSPDPRIAIDARFEIEVIDDFVLVRQAIDRMLEQNPAVFDDAPLMRARLMPALLTALGSSEHSAPENSGRENAWCCIDDSGMPSAARDVPEVDAAVMGNEQLRPFFRYCATCHLTAEQFPPNFLSGKANQVAENLRRCAPRMLVRLSAWRTPAKQRLKSPMPPVTALPALGTTAQQWASSEDFEQLRAYVEKLARESDQLSEVSAAAGEAYEGLPSCLPTVH